MINITRWVKVSFTVIALLFTFLINGTAAFAAVLTVSTGQDGAVGSVAGCTLREAINAVNNGAAGNGCANSSNQAFGNNDQILFATNANTVLLTQPLNPIASVAVIIQQPVTIRGNGSTVTRIDGASTDRTLLENSSTNLRLVDIQLLNARTALINNFPAASVTLESVRIVDFRGRALINKGRMTINRSVVANNEGGGIVNSSPILISSETPPLATTGFPAQLTILRSTVSGNGPAACPGIANGGGIAPSGLVAYEKQEGVLTITESRITENDAGQDVGGGICNASRVVITRSEISRNRARQGAGIAATGITANQLIAVPIVVVTALANLSHVTTIDNSTISSNRASESGGGIFVGENGGELRMKYCTIAFNRADGTGAVAAGGIGSQAQMTAVSNFNVLARNVSAAAGVPIQNCANITLQGNFNFWATQNTGTCALDGQSNVTRGNPLLGALLNNGGFGRTHLPGLNSVLVDVIPTNNTSCNGLDQRSRPRPVDGNFNVASGCDIGAVERP